MSLQTDSKYVLLISSRLRNFRQKKDYLWNFSCPFCGDSTKNKTKARGYVFQKAGGLIYNCHNCGKGTTVGNLVKQVDQSLYKEYALERYKSGEQGNSNYEKPKFKTITPPKFGKVQRTINFAHSDWCHYLPENHYCHAYLTRRKIPKEHWSRLLFTPKYRMFIDDLVPNHGKDFADDARLVIPFYNEYDELVAVSGRALENSSEKLRYLTFRTNDDDKKLIYGLDRIDKNKQVRIVEGPLDSLFLDNCCASGDANLSIAAQNVNANDMVLIFDNEPRNKEIVAMVELAIDKRYKVVLWPENLNGKDINEMIMSGMTKEQIESIISKNTFSGLPAKLQWVYWKKT
jgi:transcription elongation factor Elf1